MNIPSSPNLPPVFLYVVLVWSILVKGVALWRSAKNNQKYWFIAILILNTVGILELVYLFGFAKQKLTLSEIKDSVTGFLSKKA